jgi:hypothetical protein
MSRLSLACALLLLAAPVARAETSDAERARALPGRLGLTGFHDMVDARVPKLLSVRGGLSYRAFVTDQDFRGAIDTTRELETHDVDLYAGVSALGLLDAAIRVPIVYRRDDVDLRGVGEQLQARYDQGVANLDVAGKVSLDLGPISLAPYASGKLPTGDGSLDDLARFDFGVAATFTLFNEYLAIHANVGGLTEEEGLQAFRYRIGASAVVFATKPLLVRIYGYGDGLEYEGRADTDFDIDFGAQAIIFGIFQVGAGFTTRLVNGQYIDDELRDRLDFEGVFDRHFDDDGTWALELNAGVVFDF